MSHDEPKQTHPSYGMIQICRITGGKRPLFGSSIVHGESIRIRVSTASLQRDLHRDWIYDESQIVEIELSPVQYAEMLTHMNTQGVPCTILRREGKGIPECPYVDKKDMFKNEFRDKVSRIAECMENMGKAIDELKSAKSIKKSDMERIAGMFANVRQDIVSNMPFAADQFNEHMERATTEAKGEIEAFMLHKALRMAEEGFKMVERIGEQSDNPSIELEPDTFERKPGPDY